MKFRWLDGRNRSARVDPAGRQRERSVIVPVDIARFDVSIPVSGLLWFRSSGSAVTRSTR
jgi:hypothetical protein